MSFYDDASLIMYPSGYKADKIYSLKPTDGSGDFDFARASTATRVNESGLIETVATGVPRIDYTGGGCGSLLLEPQSTNLVTYSSEFDNAAWTKTRLNAFGSGSVVNAIVSPDGTTNADYIQQETGQTTGGGVSQNLSITGIHSWSLFAKASECEFLAIRTRSTTVTSSYFNLTNGTVALADPDHSNVEIQSFGNGWYKCSVSDSGGALANRFIVGGRDGVSETVTPNNGIYIYGAQLEQGYATSYIPTAGSQVTRVAETANGAGDASTFNDSEGVLMAQISALANDENNRSIAVINNNSNRISFRYDNSANRIEFYCIATTQQYGYLHTLTDIKEILKVAFLYSNNNFQVWINGIKVDFQNSGSTPTGLNSLDFKLDGGANDFYGNTKKLLYFPSALTDADLEELTSWVSFSEMATDLKYTIE